MSFSRRHFIASASSVAAGGALPVESRASRRAGRSSSARCSTTRATSTPTASRWCRPRTLAAEEINAAGGLLGRKIQVIQYDTQSDIALYTKYAQQLARDDKVDVVHGGITSASREAIRQTFRRANVLYFYNVLYEGGVCDRNCVRHRHDAGAGGASRSSRSRSRSGARRSTCWRPTTTTARSPPSGSRTTSSSAAASSQTDFFPLDVADFGSTIAKIQQEPSPTAVCAALVGGAHLSFFRQWAASGHEQEDSARSPPPSASATSTSRCPRPKATAS